MGTVIPNFSFPPPTWNGPPIINPLSVWQNQFESKITTLITTVTDKMMMNINSLANKIEIMSKNDDSAKQTETQRNMSNLQVETATGRAIHQQLHQQRQKTRNNEYQSTNNRDDLSGPAKARPYQHRNGTNQNNTRMNHERRYENSERNSNKNQHSRGRNQNNRNQNNRRQGPPVPSNNNRLDAQDMQPTRPPLNSTFHSQNTDMPKIIKGVHKFASINHHKGNWTQTPPSVMKNILQITDNIKPTLYDESFTSKARLLAEQFAEGLAFLVQEHLDLKQQEIETELMQLNPTDKKITFEIVKKQFVRKQSHKYDDNKMRPLILEAIDRVGFNFVNRTHTDSNPIETSNRFGVLSIPDETETAENSEETTSYDDSTQNPLHGYLSTNKNGSSSAANVDIATLPEIIGQSNLLTTTMVTSQNTGPTNNKHASSDTTNSNLQTINNPELQTTNIALYNSPTMAPNINARQHTCSISEPSHSPRDTHDDFSAGGHGPTNRELVVRCNRIDSKAGPHLSEHDLRSKKTNSITQPTTEEYKELKERHIFIYPNKTKPSATELGAMPNKDCEVLVIGDSNLQFVRHIPNNWELLSISGLRIEDATPILQGIPEPDDCTVKHVILAIGLNDRRQSKPPLADCIRAAAGRKHGRRLVSFLEVVDPGFGRTKELTATQNIERLNQAARSTKEVKFVPAPENPTFHGSGFHFDPEYTDKIIKCLGMHILSLN